MARAELTGGEIAWETLLERATLTIDVDGRAASLGTGFLAAPDIVVTCAHVLAAADEPLPSFVRGRFVSLGVDVELAVDPAQVYWDPATGLDLALLRISGSPLAVPVALSADLRTDDPLHSYGHPAGAFRAGQHATFTYQGASRRGQEPGALRLPRGFGVPVGPGFSGSPVVNVRTGAVCGMLTTSDKAGSAHLLPASEILHRLDGTRADPRWLAALSDGQLVAGGWPYPARWLRDYLRAALAEATERRGDGPDVLTAYVPQDLETDPDHPESEETISVTLRGDVAEASVFTAENDVLVLGAPGRGKSTLTRVVAAKAALHWLGDDVSGREPGVPVRIHAGALTGPGSFAVRLAAAVDAALGRYLRVPLPEGVFGAAPVAGSRWLVLVDGLDEMSEEPRRDVVTTLRQNSAGPYRFVVTSRPVPYDDLVWGPSVHVYDLRPLTRGQLIRLASAWFAGLPDPQAAVQEFLPQALGVAGDLTSSPLMATLLCRLFLDNPDRRLPSGQYALYARLVEVIRAAQYASVRDGVIRHIRTIVEPYGSQPTATAELLPDRIDDLLPDLARAWLNDDRPSFVARDPDVLRKLLEARTEDLRPSKMPQPEWAELVDYCARRSGILVADGGDLGFLHRTIAEFVAAGRAAADPKSWAAMLSRVFGDPRRPRVLDDDPSPSDVFLLGAESSAEPPLTTVLLRLLSRNGAARALVLRTRTVMAGDLEGAAFVSRLANQGIALAPAVRDLAVERLRGLRDAELNQDGRLAVASALAALDVPEGLDELDRIATDPQTSAEHRIDAALRGAAFGDARFTDLLAAFADDPDAPMTHRRAAAEVVASLGDTRGVDWLYGVAVNPDSGLNHFRRIDAAEMLRVVEDDRYERALVTLATEEDIPDDDRNWVLRRLRDHGGALYPKALAAVATDRRLNEDDRGMVLEALAEIGGTDYTDVLAAVVVDPTFRPELRARAAEQLVEEDDPRGTELMEAIDAYPAFGDPGDALADFATLAALGDPYGADRLAETATGEDDLLAYASAVQLAQFGDHRGLDAVAAYARDTDMDSGIRYASALQLAYLGDARAPGLLEQIAEDRTLDPDDRIIAAAALGRLPAPANARYLDLLAALAGDDTIGPDNVIHVAAALGRLDDFRGPDRLADVVADSALDPPARLRAAIALSKIGDRRGADGLEVLAAASAIPSGVRLSAANALDRRSDRRAVRAYAALAADTEADEMDRLYALAALVRYGYTTPLPDLFGALAAEGLIDETGRQRAEEWFAHLDD